MINVGCFVHVMYEIVKHFNLFREVLLSELLLAETLIMLRCIINIKVQEEMEGFTIIGSSLFLLFSQQT